MKRYKSLLLGLVCSLLLVGCDTADKRKQKAIAIMQRYQLEKKKRSETSLKGSPISSEREALKNLPEVGEKMVSFVQEKRGDEAVNEAISLIKAAMLADATLMMIWTELLERAEVNRNNDGVETALRELGLLRSSSEMNEKTLKELESLIRK